MSVTGPVGPAERSRLTDTFVALCEIESPSGREAEAAAYVRSELEALGLSVAAGIGRPSIIKLELKALPLNGRLSTVLVY